MQILAVVNVTTFLLVMLLFLVLLTPHDSRRAGNRKTGFYPRSDSQGSASFTKQGESR